ncbi:MAG TPA: hypothetical protein PKA63_01730 [Oligoflexia bacterium]|nr:hypothetical protein [Oligoflexia bacterium]HMP47370.1 hypothetical protein [Oligoflexia bacterium]
MNMTDNNIAALSENMPSLISIENVIEFDFNPERSDLSDAIMGVLEILETAKSDDSLSIRLVTRSPLILILLPSIIPLSGRLKIEFQLETDYKSAVRAGVETRIDDSREEFAKTRRFRELLEAASVFSSHQFSISFTKSLFPK